MEKFFQLMNSFISASVSIKRACYLFWLIISRADIGLPVYPRPSVLGGKNISFTPVPVIRLESQWV